MSSNASHAPDDNAHLWSCWRHQDCAGCLHDPHTCGWCPFSSVCVPVASSNLLAPVSAPHICPLSSERFELRTSSLGCGCSTATLLSVIVTVFATIAALLVLAGVGICLRNLNPFLGGGQLAGTFVEVKDDGTRIESSWRRDSWWNRLVRAFTRPDLRSYSEQEVVTDRSRLLG